jgi:hypothetical protein
VIILLALIAGVAWRRWWGDERPSWAYPGYRATQALSGWAVLFLLCVIADPGDILRNAARAALVIGFMSLPIRVSMYGFTDFWKWVDERVGTPKLGRWFTGYTTYAEATQGAALWLLAVII